MKYKLLASSGSREGIIKLISEYYYGTNITLEILEWYDRGPSIYKVSNSKGQINGVRVQVKTSKKWLGEKWIFERGNV